MNIQPLMTTKSLELHAAALSDRGQNRTINEDSVFQFSEHINDQENIGIYVVCDGMGGYEAGDVASQMVIQTIVAALSKLLIFNEGDVTRSVERPLTAQRITNWLYNTILEANEKIRTTLNEGTIKRMGSTITAVIIYNEHAYVANVGDSRAYLWRAGLLTQITSDHSLLNELIKAGTISAEQAHTHSMRNVLTQAVSGNNLQNSIDIFEQTLQSGDRLLLCSDGLWTAYPNEAELAERIATADRPVDLCWQLVAEANQRDGSDNISAVTIFVV